MNYLCDLWHESFSYPHLSMLHNMRSVTDNAAVLKEPTQRVPLLFHIALPWAVSILFCYHPLRSGGNNLFIFKEGGTNATCYCRSLLTMTDETRADTLNETTSRVSKSLSRDMRIRGLNSQQKAWLAVKHVKGWEGRGWEEAWRLLFQTATIEKGPTGCSSRINLKQKAADNKTKCPERQAILKNPMAFQF